MFAFGNWIYWILISKLTTTYEIGRATTIYSLVILIFTLTQLGLEFPLLRRSSSEASRIFSATFLIELSLTIITIPIVVYFIDNVYKESFHVFVWIAVAMLISLPVGFVSNFLLLGKFDAKKILIIDTLGMFIKFFFGFILVSYGFGALGVLISFLLQSAFMSGILFVFAKKKFELVVPKLLYVKEIFIDGLSNMPAKLSRTFIFSLSVVLLAYLGIASSDIGIFYIALMISVVAGSLFSSISYMVIPASSQSKRDLSVDTIRIVISLTALLVVVLMASPKTVLFIIGKEYLRGESILLVLAFGILPFAIVENAISKFNYLGQLKKLLSVGLTELLVFIASFLLLVPYYGSLGGALAIVASFVASGALSIYWLERELIKYIANSCIAIAAGWAAGLLFASFSSSSWNMINQLVVIFISISVSSVVIMGLKSTSIAEIKYLIKATVSSSSSSADKDTS
jgi:O-antigen/teichoic acid export membrane protein